MRRILFPLLLSAQLAPVWAFAYLPTQDGPSHVLNALVLRDCGDPGARDHEFYERRVAPIPNWTAELLLAGLSLVMPPLMAEKVLASIYVLGLPLAVDFFLAGLGGGGEAALLGLLFVFSRSFFLGFYNFNLSLILLFVALGVFVRPGVRSPTIRLAALLTLAYFTHLAGYLLASFSLLWLWATGPEPRRKLGELWPALMPGAILAAHYLRSSQFFAEGGPRAIRGWLAPVPEGWASALLMRLPEALHREIFAVHAAAWPIGLLALAAAACLCRRPVPRGWAGSLAGLAGVLLLCFVLVPDHLGAQGGFLKARLAPLPFLLALALLPGAAGRRSGPVTALLVAVVTLNLGLVLTHVAARNRELAAFTAARHIVRTGETLFAVKPAPRGRAPLPAPLVDPFAADYYCLAPRAVCLANYEGATRHFPLRLRPGVKERIKQNRPGSFWADVILSYQADADALPLASEPYVLVFSQGSLRLFRRAAASIRLGSEQRDQHPVGGGGH